MTNDILARFTEILRQSLTDYRPGMEADFAVQIERQLRAEYGGESVKIRKTPLRGEALRAEIRRRWNGRNAEDIARDMNVHLATVYRALAYRRP